MILRNVYFEEDRYLLHRGWRYNACCKCFSGVLILRQLKFWVLVTAVMFCTLSLASPSLALFILDQLVDGGKLGKLPICPDQFGFKQQIGVRLRNFVGLRLQHHVAVVDVGLNGELVDLILDRADDATAVKGLEGRLR